MLGVRELGHRLTAGNSTLLPLLVLDWFLSTLAIGSVLRAVSDEARTRSFVYTWLDGDGL